MSKYENILKEIDKEGLVKFTQDLIRIRSVYNPDKEGSNEEEVAHFVAERLKNMGWKVFIEEVIPGRTNVIAVLKGNQKGKTLLLEAHTDVVTEGDWADWKYPPFAAIIKEGKIYGRGACDTKGNLAAMVYAIKAILDSKTDFKGEIILCIPVDEEGMMLGIKHFIKQGWADEVDAAIICEPEENNICIAQKGAIRAMITVKGKMAHGAIPEAGINPNWGMARILVELENLQQEEIKKWGKHNYLGYPSITPTILRAPVQGEAQINVIPRECMTALDIRTIPGQEHDILKKKILDIFKKLSLKDTHFKAEMSVIEERPWTETSLDELIVKATAKAFKYVTKKEPIYNGVPGATDGTFLKSWKNIPIVTIGAGNRLIPHQANEYVEIKELMETVKIYALTTVLFLNEEIG
ncbi:MAG: M20 family metallopeptidase [Candidatus Atribacteria bacterium]|nr:M20 family metallopeptidase [Candidatus Atribacteria bacterium]